MARNPPAAEGSATERASSWRELAVARSLDPARARAEQRVQRFLDAALELMRTESGREFTVQDVVERSGQSLRSFYQYFAGKHELLLALFEEAVRTTAEQLTELIADVDDPLERLHLAAVEHYQLCRPTPKTRTARKSGPTPAAMAEFGQQLLTAHPREASRAFVPVVSLFERMLDDAAEVGAIRPGMDHRRVAGVVLQAIMFNAFAATISGSSIGPDGAAEAEELWDLLIRGLGTSESA